MERIALAHALLLARPENDVATGELGYDLNLFDCGNGTFNESCKLDEKPALWEYLDIPERRRLVKHISAFANLKASQPVFTSWDFNVDMANGGKRIHLYSLPKMPSSSAILKRQESPWFPVSRTLERGTTI